MPQPVHYSAASIGFDFRPEVLLQRPALAARIMVISALWNEIEARTGTLLAALLRTEAKTAVTVFLTLQNDGAKRAAIDAICELKMRPADRTRFQEIQQNLGKRYKDRNRMVHGAWGISAKYPDALLWADIRETILFHVKMMGLANRSNEARRAEILAQQRTLLVYREQDFVAVEGRIRSAYDELCAFSKPIMEDAFGPGARVDWQPPPPPKQEAAPPGPTDC